jgi:hypothetical protein
VAGRRVSAAHTHPDVLAMWERCGAVCDYMPLHDRPETRDMFAQFEPIKLS